MSSALFKVHNQNVHLPSRKSIRALALPVDSTLNFCTTIDVCTFLVPDLLAVAYLAWMHNLKLYFPPKVFQAKELITLSLNTEIHVRKDRNRSFERVPFHQEL